MSPLLYGPFVIVYAYKTISEIFRPSKFKPRFMDKTQLLQHKRIVLKLNFFLIPNLLFVAAFAIGFAYLLCARLDG